MRPILATGAILSVNDRSHCGELPSSHDQALFLAKVQGLIDDGTYPSLAVDGLDAVLPLQLWLDLETETNRFDLFGLDSESCREGRAGRPPELDPRRLEPDDEVGAQQTDEHHHQYWIDSCVDTAAEGGAHVVACLPVEWQGNANLSLIRCNECNASPGSPIGGEEIQAPAE